MTNGVLTGLILTVALASVPALACTCAHGSHGAGATHGQPANHAANVPAQSPMPMNPAFGEVIEEYELIRVALLHDTTDQVPNHAENIARLVDALSEKSSSASMGVPAESTEEMRRLLVRARTAGVDLARAETIDGARAAFGTLSEALIPWRDMISGGRPAVVYCSMAKKWWMQPSGEIGNPYFGQSMATCGQVVGN